MGDISAQDAVKIVRDNMDVARTIVSTITQLGYGADAKIGVLANAVYESSLNPNAKGDEGLSFGVCQLHTTKGAGASYQGPKTDLFDPATNIRHLFQAEGSIINNIDQQTNDIRVFAEEFCKRVERPADKETKAIERGDAANAIASDSELMAQLQVPVDPSMLSEDSSGVLRGGFADIPYSENLTLSNLQSSAANLRQPNYGDGTTAQQPSLIGTG